MFWPVVIAVALGFAPVGLTDAAAPKGYATYAECDARLDQMLETIAQARGALPFPPDVEIRLKGSCIDVPPWQFFSVETKAA